MTNFWQQERIERLVRRQQGRITWAQLTALGASPSTIHSWTRAGHLIRILPKVYAVGHIARSRRADLWTAVLYAGPGAQLCHASAAHHRGLIIHPPPVIHVSTPRVKVRSVQGLIRVHAGRDLARGSHDGIPTTAIAQTVLDLAASEPIRLVRRALAVLDYNDELDVAALEANCGRGRPGSRALRDAIAIHQPELANTNGDLEEALLQLCERFNVPVPRFNAWLHGVQPDAYWPDHNLVVEVDGLKNHSKPAQIRADRRKELTLRAHGVPVIRYDWPLVTGAPQEVARDLLRELAARR